LEDPAVPWITTDAMAARVSAVPLRPELRSAWEALRSQPGQRWTLDQLASEAHLSRSQFGRLFVRAFGKPPLVYLRQIRVQALAHMLRTTTDPVAECARAVGWPNPSYAAKQFRRVTGMSPTQYRALPMPGQGFTRDR
jgi:AraC-like DNA-binding protein